MEKKRIYWIDITKCFGIFLVILGHVCTNENVHNIIYSFHMPLFFIISGYLYRIEKKDKFIKKNFKSLMIPFYFYGIISFIYWFFIERKLRSQVISPLLVLCNFFIFNASNNYFIENVALWFLPCLFFIKNIVYFYEKKIYKDNIFIKILTCFILIIFMIISYIIYRVNKIDLFFMINRIGIYLPFFILGIFFYNRKILNNKKSFNFVIYLFTFIIFTLINYKVNTLIINMILYYIIAIVGSVFLFEISKFFNFQFLNYLGKNSLSILCIHEPIKRILIKLISIIFKVSDSIIRNNFLISIVISLILIIILLPLIFFINKYLSFSIGKINIKEKKI